MSSHVFAVGEHVSLDSVMRRAAGRADIFVVKTQMPQLGGELQYRIKTESEPYDRVVTEAQLTRVEAAAAE